MSPSTQQTASFFWVKYGFDTITPPKMYNSNVSCAILRSFVKNNCAKDMEDLCKQKNIQLGIEMNALNKTLQAAQTRSANKSSVAQSGQDSRPSSGAASSQPITPNDSAIDDEIAEILATKTEIENQLQVVAEAAKLAKELAAGTVFVDLADDHGSRLKLDETSDARANTILKHRAHYTAVAVSVDDNGVSHAVPLLFKLQKPSPLEEKPPSRPSSGAAKATGTTVT
ncbi:hypothetical protein PHMEG_00019219 [Phytophthora megakarya]|uniref:Uncharacterized protein n=1 Tax=Phytophthora megakarya TaxID=4795 RepID=A0A225VTL2_9STRA|nr:hypothetical protein PHMEG_00019219 [Phytophthora megakarya]